MKNLQNTTFSEIPMKMSVLVITYNHEKFISQAIESILNQKTNFNYEIIISEDFSTDNTRNVVLAYKAKYPDKIKLILAERNFNSNRFFVQTLQKCEGQYVALIEGDDYWNSPYKLQKQVDFLDSHCDCSICFHDVIELYEDNSSPPRRSSCIYQKNILSIQDLLAYNFCYTCTAMFRNGLIRDFPDFYLNDLITVGDYPLWTFYAQLGKIGYIHEAMGTYRIHSKGLWSSQDKISQLLNEMQVNEYINDYLQLKYKKVIGQKLTRFNYHLATEYEKRGDLDQALRYFRKTLNRHLFSQKIVISSLKKNIIFTLLLTFKSIVNFLPEKVK